MEDEISDQSAQKIMAAAILFIASLLMGLLPLLPWLFPSRRSPLAASVLLCFSVGVMFATVMIHLLPKLVLQMQEWTPIAFCIGFFIVYLLDELCHLNCPSNQPITIRTKSLNMSNWSAAFIHRFRGNDSQPYERTPLYDQNSFESSDDSSVSSLLHGNKLSEHHPYRFSSGTEQSENVEACLSKEPERINDGSMGLLYDCQTRHYGSILATDSNSEKSSTFSGNDRGCVNPSPDFRAIRSIGRTRSNEETRRECHSEHISILPRYQSYPSGMYRNYTFNHSEVRASTGGSDDSPGSSDDIESCNLSQTRQIGLIISLIIHSLIEGLDIGMEEISNRVYKLNLAILCHRLIVTFSFGYQLKIISQSIISIFLQLLVFAAASSSGIGIGMVVTKAEWADSATSIVEAAAGGALLYTLFSILDKEKLQWCHHPSSKFIGLLQFLLFLCGFCIVYGFDKHVAPDLCTGYVGRRGCGK